MNTPEDPAAARYDAFRDSEREGWDVRADGYDDATARATRQSIPTLLAHARLIPGARVLDAGCGPGYVAACADLLGARTHGIDFAPGMVAEAHRRFPKLSFAVGDVLDIDAPDGAFDAVLSNIVLFHVTDPRRAMAEARRVLRPGGRFVFSQWLGPDPSPCYAMLFDVLKAHADMTLADPTPDAYALSDPETVAAMLKEAGFAGVRSEVVPNVLHAPGDSFFDFFMRFGVRVPLILDRQDAEVRQRIAREIDAAAQEYRTDTGYAVPMPSVVFSGVAR